MKLTESQLRKIIREELEAVREADDGIQIGSIKGRFSKKFGSRLQKVLAIKAKKKEELGRDPTSDELQDAMRAAGMKDPDEEAPMEESPLQEDGHTDVASARRMMRTICHNSGVILETLKTMPGEDPLPSWWTNKSAVVADKIQGMRDYLVVSSDE